MLETLYSQLEEVRKAIATEGQADKIIELQAQEANILAEIDKLKEPQSADVFVIGGIEFAISTLAVDEDAVKIIQQGTSAKLQAQAQKWLSDVNALKADCDAKVFALTTQRDHLQGELDEAQEANAQLHIDNEDLSEKRDNAVRALEEEQAESARKDARIAELEQRLASAPTANSTIEIENSEELQAIAQRFKEKQDAAAQAKKAEQEANKIRVYGMYQVDVTGSQFGAYRADNDEFITFGWLEKSKYVNLSNEELERFRAEQAEKELAASDSGVATEVTLTPPELSQFQSEEPAVSEHSLDGTVASNASETVPQTLEDRVAALEAAVFGQAKVAE